MYHINDRGISFHPEHAAKRSFLTCFAHDMDKFSKTGLERFHPLFERIPCFANNICTFCIRIFYIVYYFYCSFLNLLVV